MAGLPGMVDEGDGVPSGAAGPSSSLGTSAFPQPKVVRILTFVPLTVCASVRFYGPGDAVLQRWSLDQVLGGVHFSDTHTGR